MQIPPIFSNIPGYQKPLILTNISNLRIRKKMTPIKNITNPLNFFSFVTISK